MESNNHLNWERILGQTLGLAVIYVPLERNYHNHHMSYAILIHMNKQKIAYSSIKVSKSKMAANNGQ